MTALLAGAGCAPRRACNDETSSGPRVRLDVALGTCNSAPTAVIAGPITATQGSTVALDGSSSTDPDGDALNYKWTLVAPTGSSSRLDQADAAQVRFPIDFSGSYRVSLVVNDGEFDSVAATRSYLIQGAAPTARAGSDREVPLFDEVVLDGSASAGPSGIPLTYRWTFVSKPMNSVAPLRDATLVRARFNPDVAGIYEVSLVVTADSQSSESDKVRIAAGVNLPVNRAPIANAGPDQTVSSTATVTLDGSGSSDPDGDALTYSWRITSQPAASRLPETLDPIARPAFAPLVAGNYEITLVVRDENLESPPDTVRVTVEGDPIVTAAFDPKKVYLFTPLLHSLFAEDYVICDLARPSSPGAGFPVFVLTGRKIIRPTDGALLYLYKGDSPIDIRRFVPDSLRYDASDEHWDYPNDVTANDPVVLTIPCNDADFTVHPVTGRIFYDCSDNGITWFDDTHQAVGCNDGVFLPGYDGSYLCGSKVYDRNGVGHELEMSIGSARARPEGGFWALKFLNAEERWVINPDGTTRVDLAYGSLPAGRKLLFDGEGRFDGEGNLYSFGANQPENDKENILRFAGTSTATIVYDEAMNFDCEIARYDSFLVSGP